MAVFRCQFGLRLYQPPAGAEVVLLAIGGSTNAIVHLTAIAGRLGIDIDLNRLNRLSDETPVLIDLKRIDRLMSVAHDNGHWTIGAAMPICSGCKWTETSAATARRPRRGACWGGQQPRSANTAAGLGPSLS